MDKSDACRTLASQQTSRRHSRPGKASGCCSEPGALLLRVNSNAMKNTVVVVTDLACLKAYRIDPNPQHSTPRLELVDEFHSNGAHERLADKVTDQSGRFPRNGGPISGAGAMSAGERHNILLEERRRTVRQLAGRLNTLLARTDVEHCLLAVSKEINHQLLEELPPAARGKIQKHLAADLTKLEKSELLRHFTA